MTHARLLEIECDFGPSAITLSGKDSRGVTDTRSSYCIGKIAATRRDCAIAHRGLSAVAFLVDYLSCLSMPEANVAMDAVITPTFYNIATRGYLPLNICRASVENTDPQAQGARKWA